MGLARQKPSLWSGRLQLGDGWAVWRGEVGDAVVHRHFAAQAVFSSDPIEIVDGEGRAAAGRCILVDPLVPHRLRSRPEAELIFLEPSSRLPAEIADRLIAVRRAGPLVLLSAPSGDSFWTRWLAGAASSPGDEEPRIAAAVSAIEAMIEDGSTTLAGAARAAGLSPDRFRHLFAERMGIPFRRYVLWRRLKLAAAALQAGADATSAAHAAGFADSAHFARTLKATFGVTAGQALMTDR